MIHRPLKESEKEISVSQLSRFSSPLDIASHPTLEPEVKRAILASWASDRASVPGCPALRQPPDAERPVEVDEVLDALKLLDRATDDRPARQSTAAVRRTGRGQAPTT